MTSDRNLCTEDTFKDPKCRLTCVIGVIRDSGGPEGGSRGSEFICSRSKGDPNQIERSISGSKLRLKNGGENQTRLTGRMPFTAPT